MPKALGMKCRECGEEYPVGPIHVCDLCFGPLEVQLNWEEITPRVTRKKIEAGPTSMWRYHDLLPVEGPPTVGKNVGWTPLVKAERLGRELGLNNLYIKNDAVNHPTLSFKDRVVAVRAHQGARVRLRHCRVRFDRQPGELRRGPRRGGRLQRLYLHPHDLEQGKVLGTLIYGANVLSVSGNYDEVNRLCAEAGGKYGWAFVNINLRPFYGDGSKTFGYEIAEQLGWRAPEHVIVPCAGGSLIRRSTRALNELDRLGLLDGGVPTKMYVAHRPRAARRSRQ